FFKRRIGERLMRRMQSLFGRSNTQTDDIDILRGFFNTFSHRIHKKD
ncbi:RNA methyltransferase, partial [Neisseria sp. P0014.S004]